MVQVFRASVAGIGFARLFAEALELPVQVGNLLSQRRLRLGKVVNQAVQLVQPFLRRCILCGRSRTGA